MSLLVRLIGWFSFELPSQLNSDSTLPWRALPSPLSLKQNFYHMTSRAHQIEVISKPLSLAKEIGACLSIGSYSGIVLPEIFNPSVLQMLAIYPPQSRRAHSWDLLPNSFSLPSYSVLDRSRTESSKGYSLDTTQWLDESKSTHLHLGLYE